MITGEVGAKRVFREIYILRRLQNGGNTCINIIQLRDLYTPAASADEMRELYMVCERAHESLHQLMADPTVTFQDDHVCCLI